MKKAAKMCGTRLYDRITKSMYGCDRVTTAKQSILPNDTDCSNITN